MFDLTKLLEAKMKLQFSLAGVPTGKDFIDLIDTCHECDGTCAGTCEDTCNSGCEGCGDCGSN